MHTAASLLPLYKQICVTFTTATLCAFPVCLLTRAHFTTANCAFTSALDQFNTDFRSHRESASNRTSYLAVSIHCPSTSFWAGYRLMGQFRCHPYSRLVGNSFRVLQQGILSWWDVFHCFVLLAEQLSLHFIDRSRMVRLVVNDEYVALQMFEVFSYIVTGECGFVAM